MRKLKATRMADMLGNPLLENGVWTYDREHAEITISDGVDCSWIRPFLTGENTFDLATSYVMIRNGPHSVLLPYNQVTISIERKRDDPRDFLIQPSTSTS